MILSILIPTIEERADKLLLLKREFYKQIEAAGAFFDVEIINSYPDNKTVSIGYKRNILLSQAHGQYVAFFDDDDEPSNDYIAQVLAGLKFKPDCCSLKGEITINGGAAEVFEHSVKYHDWKTNDSASYPDVKYERYPNHLNAIRKDIAQKFRFPEINHGEDHKWSQAVYLSKLIQTEHYIPSVIYFYNHVSK